MEKVKQVAYNIPFIISTGAYMILAVPASKNGILVASVITVIAIISSCFISDIREYVKKNASKFMKIISLVWCAVLGLRFPKVWRHSTQIVVIAEKLGVSSNILLLTSGVILGVLAYLFLVTSITFLICFPLRNVQLNLYKKEKEKFSYVFRYGLFVILVIQLVILIYWGIQKQGYHVDEIYTFELSNYVETVYGETKDAYATWKNGKIFSEILEPAESKLFDLTIPYWNSETDNHPMTYYMIVYIVSCIFKILGLEVNKWVALIPNIVFCLITTIFIANIMRNVTRNDVCTLIVTASWVLSIGGINTGIYLRMYALLTMWCSIFIYFQEKYFECMYENEKIDKKILMGIIVSTTAGILSQYYFLFFAFFWCFCLCIILFYKKKWEMLKWYFFAEIGAVLLAEILFPKMIVRLLFGDRGSEALKNAWNGEGYLEKLKDVWNIINEELFGGYIVVIVCVTITLNIMGILRKKSFIYKLCDINKKVYNTNLFMVTIVIVCMCYIAVIAKVAPYQVERYYMCIFPFLVISIEYLLFNCLRYLPHQKCFALILSIGILICSCVNYVMHDVSYIYSGELDRMAILEEYKTLPVIVLNGDTYDDSVLQWSFEFKKYENIFLCHNNNYADLALAIEKNTLDSGCLFYVHMISEAENEIFDKVKQYINIQSYIELVDTQNCKVFYCIVSP